jgi:hypothetical protein
VVGVEKAAEAVGPQSAVEAAALQLEVVEVGVEKAAEAVGPQSAAVGAW